MMDRSKPQESGVVIVIIADREYRHTWCLGNCDDIINELISLPKIGSHTRVPQHILYIKFYSFTEYYDNMYVIR